MTTFDDFFRSDAYSDLYREYAAEIRDLVKATRAEVAAYGGDFDDLLHERIDGHNWVIYTAKARLVDLVSDSDADEYLTEPGDTNGGTPEQRAYACMMIDAREVATEDDETDDADEAE